MGIILRELEPAGELADSPPGNRRSRVIAKVLFIALFLVGPLSLGGVPGALGGVPGASVLCLGGDGHVAIEAADSAGCGSVAPATTGSVFEDRTVGGASHCGPCIDVSLLDAFTDGRLLCSAQESQPPPACLTSHTTTPCLKHLASKTPDRAHEGPFLSIKPHTIVLRR